jgi:hypothetical protein
MGQGLDETDVEAIGFRNSMVAVAKANWEV